MRIAVVIGTAQSEEEVAGRQRARVHVLTSYLRGRLHRYPQLFRHPA
jgi:hypothetical protein